MKLPKILASSVIRTSRMGDAHGGLYLIDTNDETVEKVLDWDDQKIDWDGRGGERGLRGIAFYNDKIYLASSREIYVLDKNFRVQHIIRNKYMNYNHEIIISKDELYITSTKFDSILIYDLVKNNFTTGFCIRTSKNKKLETNKIGKTKRLLRRKLNLKQYIDLKFFTFDPNDNNGPSEIDTTHINNVFIDNGVLHFSGTLLENIYKIEDDDIVKTVKLPYGTHNVKKYKGGYLFNNTLSNPKQISFINDVGKINKSFVIPKYENNYLINNNVPKDHAVQAFGRGLCTEGDLIIGGSSPATISLYDFQTGNRIKTISITNDVRNAIHGLEIWQH